MATDYITATTTMNYIVMLFFIIIINREHSNPWQQSASILCHSSLYPLPRGWALCLPTGKWRSPVLVFQASFVRVVVSIKPDLLLLHCFANRDQQVEVCAFLVSRKCVGELLVRDVLSPVDVKRVPQQGGVCAVKFFVLFLVDSY